MDDCFWQVQHVAREEGKVLAVEGALQGFGVKVVAAGNSARLCE